ncbi:MAG: pectin acetylesterase-family hydrolase, partial [Actinomycetota bacterium]
MVFGVVCGVLAACSNDTSTSSTPALSDTTVISTDESTAPTTEAPATDESKWESITAPADCMCSDGSGFTYFVRKADPNKVLFFLEGGGACFSKDTCSPDSTTFKHNLDGTAGMTDTDGIFDFTNPQNPFANYSMVFVPYCTGDVHIGNATTDYGDGVVVHHNGYI